MNFPDAHVPPAAPVDPRVRRTELIISHTLRLGVSLSFGLIVLGTVLMFIHHPEYLRSGESLQQLMHPQRTPNSLAQVARDIGSFRGRGIITLGLLVLILTPVVRVIISIAAFAFQGDRLYVGMTIVVLAFLFASFILGHAGG